MAGPLGALVRSYLFWLVMVWISFITIIGGVQLTGPDGGGALDPIVFTLLVTIALLATLVGYYLVKRSGP